MSAFTLTIPHKLGREQAKKRIEDHLIGYRQKLQKYVDEISYEWQGDRLNFNVMVWGQGVSGFGLVRDADVLIEVDLPFMLSMFAGAMQPKIEKEAAGLLT